MMRFSAIALLLPLVACGRRDFPSFSVIERLEMTRVDVPGSIEVVASCRDGEQLMGGGYVISSVVTLSGGPSGEPANPIIVEASHPTGPDRNSWLVRAFNPDPEDDGPNDGSYVVSEAYCLSGTLPLRIEHVVSAEVIGQFDQTTPLSVSCPAGSVATSGGFETTHTVPYAGLYNAWFLSSRPTPDQSGVAVGWEMDQSVISWTDDVELPRSRVHALCATQNLQGAPIVETAILPAAPFNYWIHEGSSQCPRGQFATGGGYEFEGDPLVPHLTYEHQASEDFQGWSLEAVYGHQTGETGNVQGWAACLLAPNVPLIVEITNPAGGSFLSNSGGGQTDPVTFQAIATDGDGDPVSGVSFDWTDNGQPLGTGANFTAPLSAADCESFIEHEITVVGTDAGGNTATDAITIYAGLIC